MALTTAQVTTLLQDTLFESATQSAANAASWTNYANAVGYTLSQLATTLTQQPEFSIAQTVARLYTGVLHRTPDASGLAAWTQYAETGLTAAQIAAGSTSVSAATWSTIQSNFLASGEFTTTFAGITGAALVNLLYTNVLGRTPDAAGLAAWTAYANTGASLAVMVNGFVNSGEYVAASAPSIQSSLATYGAAIAGGASTTTTTIGTITPTVSAATTITLTTGIDSPTITGNNNTINGTYGATAGNNPTFNAGDSIVGAANSTGNILNLSYVGAAQDPSAIAGATVSNIQTVNITSSGTQTVNTASSIVGFTGLTNLNVKDVGGTGGAAITAAGTTAIGVTDIGVANTTTSIQGGSSVTFTGNAVTSAGTLNIGNTTGPLGAVTVTMNESSSQAGGVTATAINVTGGSTVNVTANLIGTTNSGQIQGGVVTITGTNGTSGTVATTAASVTQTAAATSATGVSGVTDGAVAINDGNAANSTTATVSTKTGSITTVTLVNPGSANISSAALNTLSITNSASTTNIYEGGSTSATNTTLGLTVNGVITATSGAVTIADQSNQFQTLNITAGATASNILFTDTALKTVSIGGTGNFSADLTNGGGNSSLTTVTDTDTGVSTLTLGTGTSFNGAGSGQDIITLSGTTTGTITGGSATNNILVAGFAGTGVSSFGTVTGFTSLGFNGNSSGTFDLSNFTSMNSLVVTAYDTVTVNKAAAGTTLTIQASTASFTYNQNDATSASDSLTVNLGTSTSSGVIVTTLIAADKNLIGGSEGGIGTLTIASTEASGGANTISNLDTGNTTTTGLGISSLTITGNASLTIGAWADSATTLSITNNSTSTLANAYTLTDNFMTSMTLAGSNTGATTVSLSDNQTAAGFTLTDTGAAAQTVTLTGTFAPTSLTISDSSTAALRVNNLASDANLTTATLTNTGTSTLTMGTSGLTSASINGTATLASVTATGTGAIVVQNLTEGNTTTNFTLTNNNSKSLTVTTLTASQTSGTVTITNGATGTLTTKVVGATASSGNNGTLTVNESSTGAVTISSGSSVSANAINLNNSGSGATLTVAGLTDYDTNGVTVTPTGLVSLTMTDYLGATTVSGSTNNAADTIALTTSASGFGKTGSAITLGNGANTISHTDAYLGDKVTITVGTGQNGITLQSGHLGQDSVSIGASGTTSATTYSTITNAMTGTDTITLTGNSSAVATADALTSGLNSTNTYSSIGAGITGALAGTTQNHISWFIVGSDEYIFEHGGSSTTALTATDTLVKVAGLTSGINTASLNSTTGATQSLVLGNEITAANGGAAAIDGSTSTAAVAIVTTGVGTTTNNVTFDKLASGTSTVQIGDSVSGTLMVDQNGASAAGATINLVFTAGGKTVATLNVGNAGTGFDAATVYVANDSSGAATITSLADNSTSKAIATLKIADNSGAGTTTIGGISGATALTTIDATATLGAVTIGTSSALASTGATLATIKLGAGVDTLSFAAATAAGNSTAGTFVAVNNWILDTASAAKDVLTTGVTGFLNGAANNGLLTGSGWAFSNGMASKAGGTLAQFIAGVEAATAQSGNATTNAIAGFLDGSGNTWIAYNDHGGANAAIIELVGVTALGLETGGNTAGFGHIA